jgi:flagellin FlaB
MLKKLLQKVSRSQKGITGLETAIILIAFVVVASVFAYTVLSAGIFSSQKGKEAVYSGLDQAQASLIFKGSVVANGDTTDQKVNSVVFTVSNALNSESIDLTPPTANSPTNNGLAASGSSNVTVISYTDQSQRVDDLMWSVQRLGDTVVPTTDYIMKPGEKFQITVDLSAITPVIGTYHTFTVEVKPPVGSVLDIQTTTPAQIDSIMNLN